MNADERALRPRQALAELAAELGQALKAYDTSDGLGKALVTFATSRHPYGCRHCHSTTGPLVGRLGQRAVTCVDCGGPKFASSDALIGAGCDLCGADETLKPTLNEVDEYIVIAMLCAACNPWED